MYYNDLPPEKQVLLAKNAEIACRKALKKGFTKLNKKLYGTPQFDHWRAILAYLDPKVERYHEEGFDPASRPHNLLILTYDEIGCSLGEKEKDAQWVIQQVPDMLEWDLGALGITKKLLANHKQ
jgi:hypothetical protein